MDEEGRNLKMAKIERCEISLVDAQTIVTGIAQIVDPKHKYTIRNYRQTCAFTWDTFARGKRRVIGVTHATLKNHSTNGFIRVMLHEIAHFIHDQRYRKRLDLLRSRRSHRKTFTKLETFLKAKFESIYGEMLPTNCWEV